LPSPIDIDVTNDSLPLMWLAIPPQAAANLAISSAEQIDRELEEASPDLIAKIESLAEKFRLDRSIHRKLHVDQIQKALNSRSRTEPGGCTGQERLAG
jgi:hypothetical protein